jgi:hypothetical protein
LDLVRGERCCARIGLPVKSGAPGTASRAVRILLGTEFEREP